MHFLALFRCCALRWGPLSHLVLCCNAYKRSSIVARGNAVTVGAEVWALRRSGVLFELMAHRNPPLPGAEGFNLLSLLFLLLLLLLVLLCLQDVL
jgi:hypothetical protein